jgi:hypothetical protein
VRATNIAVGRELWQRAIPFTVQLMSRFPLTRKTRKVVMCLRSDCQIKLIVSLDQKYRRIKNEARPR